MKRGNRKTTVSAAKKPQAKDTAIYTPDTAPITYPDTVSSSSEVTKEEESVLAVDQKSTSVENSDVKESSPDVLKKTSETIYPESFLTNKVLVNVSGLISPTGKLHKTITELVDLCARNVTGTFAVKVPASTLTVLIDIFTNSTTLVPANLTDADRARSIKYLKRDNFA